MILINKFEKFRSIINDLSSSNIPVKIYGKYSEVFTGSHAGFQTPPNNTLSIKIVALTSIGTIYYNENIKLSNTDAVQTFKTIINSMNITESDISFNRDSGIVTLS